MRKKSRLKPQQPSLTQAGLSSKLVAPSLKKTSMSLSLIFMMKKNWTDSKRKN